MKSTRVDPRNVHRLNYLEGAFTKKDGIAPGSPGVKKKALSVETGGLSVR